MLCNTCSKLASMNTQKTCLRCNSFIYINLSVICDNCSKTEKLCSICLKKLYNPAVKPKSNCGNCGNNK